eukprot:SAG25_NODE_652_length_6157_cov_9.608947_5_plen_139_part_00
MLYGSRLPFEKSSQVWVGSVPFVGGLTSQGLSPFLPRMPSVNSGESIRDSQTMGEVCLKFLNVLTLAAAGLLLYIGITQFAQGEGLGVWVPVLLSVVVLMVISSVLGWKAADGNDEKNNMGDACSKAVSPYTGSCGPQ